MTAGVGCSLYKYVSSNQGNIFAVPMIAADSSNTMSMSFNSYTASSSAYGIEVGVMSDLDNPDSFVLVQLCKPSIKSAFENFIVNFEDYTGDGKFITFRQGSTSYYTYYIDDVEVYQNLRCKQPYAVTASNVTSSSARLSWASANSEPLYRILVSPEEILPDTSSLALIDDIQDSYYTLTNLQPKRVFYVFVQAA